MKKIFFLLTLSLSIFAKEVFYFQDGKKTTLTPIENKKTQSVKNLKHYKTQNGNELAVNNEILLKLRNKENIDKYLKKYSLTLIKKYKNNLFLVKTNDNLDVFDIANNLYEESGVLYAHPNFIKKIKSR